MSDIDEEPRSFRLSRGRSDLSSLFVGLLFGAILIASPTAGLWIWRVILVGCAAWLFFEIRSVRRLRGVVAWQSSFRDPLGVLMGVAILGVWVWYVARGFAAGQWIDPSIGAVIVAEGAYIEWFKARHGAAGE